MMNRFKPDVKVMRNSIGGRQGCAYVFNSMKVTVLSVDLDAPQEYENFKKFGKVRVMKQYRGQDMAVNTTLEWTTEDGWFLGQWGCCISNSYSWYDVMEDLENSMAPVIRSSEDLVAIVSSSQQSKTASISLYHIGRVDSNCQTVCKLNPLTDEEMTEVVKDIERWCNQ